MSARDLDIELERTFVGDMEEEQQLSFFLEWYDPQSDQRKPYILHYHGDNTLEMVCSTRFRAKWFCFLYGLGLTCTAQCMHGVLVVRWSAPRSASSSSGSESRQ